MENEIKKAGVSKKLSEFIKGPATLDRLSDRSLPVIIVIGASDSGKTTLIEGLSDMLSRHMETGIIDLDMGQSHIGAPTTMAWGRVKGGFKGWGDIKVEDLYFTGTTSPPGNLLPALVGAKKLRDKAASKCPKVIIDTTGLVSEPLGRVFKQYKIDLLSPDIIIALERDHELENILSPYKNLKKPTILRIDVPEAVKLKSRLKRFDFRAVRFRHYFENSIEIRVNIKKTGVRFTRSADEDGLIKRAVSFRDSNGDDIGIGVIEGADLDNDKLIIRTPLKEGVRFAALVIGEAKIDMV
ncbi:MAG: hypothetical protein HYS21_10295 [Deltaproteobacteria bacterium]|nr:hypothetical protein [Deltaproteobacteria bacterium]